MSQPAPGVYSSPDALVGRLYSGHGRNNRLADSSPPRNTSFGTSLRQVYHQDEYDNQERYQEDSGRIYDSNYNNNGGSGSGGGGGGGSGSGLTRPRTSANPRDSFLSEHQNAALVPRLLHPSGSMGHTGPVANNNTGQLANNTGSLQDDSINSPPRIGTRRKSSNTSGKRSGGGMTGPEEGGSKATTGLNLPRGKQGTASDQSSIGGGMSLSRSLGALGQGGGGGAGGRSAMTPAAANKLRGDSAPYVGSEKTSPNPPLRVGAAWSRGGPYPGQKHIRYANVLVA